VAVVHNDVRKLTADLLARELDMAVDLPAQGSALGLEGEVSSQFRPAQGDQDRHYSLLPDMRGRCQQE
jgi:hypothetical protein